jgi:ParB-like chromosome segregation protein Spo0J
MHFRYGILKGCTSMTSVSREHKIVMVAVTQLKPYPRNARRHSKTQVKQIAKSIETFGFTNPVLTGSGGQILAGHGRVEAARLLGMETVPTIPLAHLTEAEKCAYVLADNKLALNANWDQDMLAIELQGLIDLEFDVELTGFSIAETDVVIEGAKSRDTKGKDSNLDEVPPLLSRAVTVRGDLWQLGHHGWSAGMQERRRILPCCCRVKRQTSSSPTCPTM